MKVKCIKDYNCWNKGETYELHISPQNKHYMTHYLDCPDNFGYESGKWGFLGLDDPFFKKHFKVISEDLEHNEHYKACGIEPWDIMQANFTKEEFIGFLKGNITKYSQRIGRKGQDLDDCDKIIVYTKKLKEVLQDS